MTHSILLNPSGTHILDITEQNLKTIKDYSLFDKLVDSNGYIDENVLNKLRLNIRSIIASQENCKGLLDLCIDVIYHAKMKAFGLEQLIRLYNVWIKEQVSEEENIQEEDSIVSTSATE